MSRSFGRLRSVPTLLGAILLLSAASAAASPGAPPEPLNQIIIRFHRPPAADLLESLTIRFPQITDWRTFQAPVAALSPLDGAPPHPLACMAVAHVAQTTNERDRTTLITDLTQMPAIRYAEPNGYTHACYEPDDVRYPDQYAPLLMNMELAWEIETGKRSTMLAVADTGINFDHEDFSDRAIWTNYDDPINGLDDDNNGYIDDRYGWDFYYGDNAPVDFNGHGTHAAGIAGARIGNATGIAGMANLTLMPIQILSNAGWGTWDAMTAAIYYAVDNGAHAILIAGGGTDGAAILAEAVQYAAARRVTIIAAAGNDNNPTEFFPAAFDDVIAVSGSTENNQRYEASNFGMWIDVAAPAVDVLSTGIGSTSSYESRTGTSMAAAHVAGLVGLMLTIDKSLTPALVEQYLETSADDLGAQDFDVLFGHGRIDGFRTVTEVLNNMFTALLPSTFTLKKGRIISGDISDLQYNDALPMVLDAGPVSDGLLGGDQSKPIRFRVRGTSPITQPDSYYFVIEAWSDSANVEQRIRLYNFEIGEFQLLKIDTLTKRETQYRAEVSRNGYRFVDPETGWVFVQVDYFLNGAPDAQPWQVSIDRTVWSLK